MAKKDKEKKERKLNAEKIAKAFAHEIDAPLTSVYGFSYMEISGNSEAIIQGCKGVLEYGENLIRLNLGKRAVEFVGTDLIMRYFNNEQAIIEGNIASVNFI